MHVQDTDAQMRDAPYRPIPTMTPLTEPFWTSGADGLLRFLRCAACGYYTHPPGPRCANCLNRNLMYVPVSGLGTVYTFTLNHHSWYSGWRVPYVVAIVQLDEQDDLQLLTNVVGCPPESVRIGDRVRVAFDRRDEVWLPLFEPVDERA
jgi:uncharacterized protein